ncbi:MAG: hypothetical protein LBQ12_14210 [Deltaproteobacteria bacterium]|jgi:hypothetical protein|nr:hypothetical protein [Deltaproteobacteria bacterium]
MNPMEPYAKVPLEDLTDDLGYEFLDLSLDALSHYIRRAAIYMCRNGDLVSQKAHIRTCPNVVNYALEPADEAELVALLSVKCVTPCQRHNVIRALAEPNVILPGPVSWFAPPDELYLKADFQGDYEAEFSVSPSRTACEIPAVLSDRWYELLLTGARGYIHEASGKPWSDKKLSAELLTDFRHGVQQAKVECMTGFQRGVLRLNMPRVL